MSCAVCGGGLAEAVVDGLRLHACSSCGGTWVARAAHDEWQPSSWPTGDDTASVGVDAVVGWELEQELDPAKLCPADRTVLRKYAVGAGLDFRLDRCAACRGVWLDPGEWAALGREGLQTKLSMVFRDDWQEHVRESAAAADREAILRKRFGDDDLERLREVRTWLDTAPNRTAMLRYLSAAPGEAR